MKKVQVLISVADAKWFLENIEESYKSMFKHILPDGTIDKDESETQCVFLYERLEKALKKALKEAGEENE